MVNPRQRWLGDNGCFSAATEQAVGAVGDGGHVY